jgi:MoaA/NifB/PqqE/SkfB family radical SAM enzyme
MAAKLVSLVKKFGLSAGDIKKSAFMNRLLPLHVPWQPLGFTISITTKCNLKCTMCARTIYGIDGINMSKELFMESAKHFSNKTVTIMGNGEPFLHPNIFEFIEICQSKNAMINLVTNGTLLNREKAVELLKYPNIRSITFSIDGVGDNYNRIRVNGNFQTVVGNLMELSWLREYKGMINPILAINFVGMESNIDDFPRLIRTFRDYVDTIELSHPIIFSENETKQHLNRNIKHANLVFKDSIALAMECKATVLLRSLSPYFSGCIEPWVAPYIGINGNIYPCCMIGGGDPQDKVIDFYEDIFMTRNIISLGNVTDFVKIWNGEGIQEFREALKKVNVENLPKHYRGNDTYLGILKQGYKCYCKVCSYRWNCAC